jgi:hypothetical protein
MKVTPLKKKFGKHAIGTVFELPDKTARVFLKIGRIARAEEAAALIPQEVVADGVAPVQEAAPTAEAEAAPAAPRARRTYQRRDMTAEPVTSSVTKKVTKRATKKATTRSTKD